MSEVLDAPPSNLTDEDRRRLEEERAQLLSRLEQLQRVDQPNQAPNAMAAPELAPSTEAPVMAPVMPPEATQWATPVNTFTRPDLEALRQANPSAAAQYDAQVAQAQRNSGFINADVNAFGRVLSPMISPELNPQDAALTAVRAQRFAGQQQYKQLLKGGATPEEAYRATAHLLHANDPNALAKGLHEVGAPLRAGGPQVFTLNGENYYVKGNEYVHVPKPAHPDRAAELAAKDAQQIVHDEMTDLRKSIAKETDMANNPQTPDEEKRKAINRARIKREQLKALETKYLSPQAVTAPATETSTIPAPVRPPMQTREGPGGFVMSRDPSVLANSPVQPKAAPAQETITVTTKEQFDKLPSGTVYTGKDGRKYRKP